MNEPLHKPVLITEVLAQLALKSGANVIDATYGLGGYTAAILPVIKPHGRVLGIEQDPFTLEYLAEHETTSPNVRLVRGKFSDLAKLAEESGITPIDAVVFDLGISNWQLRTNQHGIAFQSEAPLDMRLSSKKVRQHVRAGTLQRLSRVRSLADLQRPGWAGYFTAYELIAGLPEKILSELFYTYGEERQASRIARALIAARPRIPRTTLELREFVARLIPRGKIDPATKVFQALRIAVNDELGQLRIGLKEALTVLKPEGRLAVVSFHSLEDRIVKQFIKQESRACICPVEQPVCTCSHTPQVKIITPKPITPSLQEIKQNPQARSAKLRVAQKLTPK